MEPKERKLVQRLTMYAELEKQAERPEAIVIEADDYFDGCLYDFAVFQNEMGKSEYECVPLNDSPFCDYLMQGLYVIQRRVH